MDSVRPKINITYFDYDLSDESECDDYISNYPDNIQDKPFIHMTHFDQSSDEETQQVDIQKNETINEVITFEMLGLVKFTLRQWQTINKNITEIIFEKVKTSPKGFKYKFISEYFDDILIGKHKKTIFCSVIESTENRKKNVY